MVSARTHIHSSEKSPGLPASARKWPVKIVRQLEAEGHFPHTHYVFDNGVLSANKLWGLEASHSNPQ